jgi:hypothetical protein
MVNYQTARRLSAFCVYSVVRHKDYFFSKFRCWLFFILFLNTCFIYITLIVNCLQTKKRLQNVTKGFKRLLFVSKVILAVILIKLLAF